MGYAGGTDTDPDYHALGNHSETIEIEYDPDQISYAELLDIFWAGHSPTVPSYSRQYMSIIFYHNEEQRQLAMKTRDQQQEQRGSEIYTEILPAGDFYLAEGYHQKHRLRSESDLLQEFAAIYPDEEDLIASTAVARVNGYLGGNGTRAQLERELSSLGLSPEGQQHLLDLVSWMLP